MESMNDTQLQAAIDSNKEALKTNDEEERKLKAQRHDLCCEQLRRKMGIVVGSILRKAPRRGQQPTDCIVVSIGTGVWDFDTEKPHLTVAFRRKDGEWSGKTNTIRGWDWKELTDTIEITDRVEEVPEAHR